MLTISQEKRKAIKTGHRLVPLEARVVMAFDVAGAREAGYSDLEIANHLSRGANFDVQGAITLAILH